MRKLSRRRFAPSARVLSFNIYMYLAAANSLSTAAAFITGVAATPCRVGAAFVALATCAAVAWFIYRLVSLRRGDELLSQTLRRRIRFSVCSLRFVLAD